MDVEERLPAQLPAHDDADHPALLDDVEPAGLARGAVRWVSPPSPRTTTVGAAFLFALAAGTTSAAATTSAMALLAEPVDLSITTSYDVQLSRRVGAERHRKVHGWGSTRLSPPPAAMLHTVPLQKSV